MRASLDPCANQCKDPKPHIQTIHRTNPAAENFMADVTQQIDAISKQADEELAAVATIAQSSSSASNTSAPRAASRA